MFSTRQAVVAGLLNRKSEVKVQTFFDKPRFFSKNRTNFFKNILKINENRRQNLLFPNILYIPIL